MRPRLSHLILSMALLAAPAAAYAQGAPMNLLPGRSAPASEAITRAAPPPQVGTRQKAEIIKRANAYLNRISTMVADFEQFGADGRRTTGRLYVQKPGRLRFEYDRPAVLEIIADGRSVAIRNRRTAKQDMYFIGQTPLKFLLQKTIDLARDVRVLDVETRDDEAMIHIEDSSTFGGTSRIRLFFANDDFTLKRWVVLDAQGFETEVRLTNLDLNTAPPARLFRINYERLDGPDN